MPRWDTTDPLLRRELPELRRALGSGPSGDVLVLRYDVDGHDGPWVHEMVLGRALYAERRQRLDGASSYAFGEDLRGAWLAVGDGTQRAAEAPWRRETRTQAALYGLEFLRPADAEEAIYLPGDGETWDYVFRPAGGHTLTLAIDRETHQPVSFDRLDSFRRLHMCAQVRWAVRHGRYVPSHMRCESIDAQGHHAMGATSTLIDATYHRAPPTWAQADPHRDSTPPCFDSAVEMAMDEELRVWLPVETPNGLVVPFVLDSGAWHTYVDEDVARVLGVVPTGEAPMYTEPPWLPSNSSWVGVVDRMTVAGIDLDGVRLLVMDGLGTLEEHGGLLGADFFRRFVVDVDTPNHAVRLVSHERFTPPRDSSLMFLHGMGTSGSVMGEVMGVDRGPLILDTGAPIRVVVHAPAMAAVRPRHPGSNVGRFYGDDVPSPDYVTDIDGLRIGPFAFPEMPAWGRDRERDRIGGGIALVGMGTMRHLRMMFDFRNQTLYATAGSGYHALARAGVELDDGEDGAIVSYVVPGGPSQGRGIRAGDVLLSVDGEPLRDAIEARSALADHHGGSVRLRVRREDRTRQITIALEAPGTTADPLVPGSPGRFPIEGPACAERPALATR